MDNLNDMGLTDVIKDKVNKGKPTIRNMFRNANVI